MVMILILIGILFLIFLMNIAPAFLPSTWIVISITAFTLHLSNTVLVFFAILAAVASTSGRMVLSLLSEKIIKNNLLSESTKKNIKVLEDKIISKKVYAYGFFLFYAFSPLPSGQLFLAYGLTNLKIKMVAIPFFIGRVFTYLFWVFTASEVSEFLDTKEILSGRYFSWSFILIQFLALYLAYIFIKIDWKVLFEEKKFRLMD